MTTNDLNDKLQTTAILWNLDDLYKSIDDRAVANDCDWCTKESQELVTTYKNTIAGLAAEELQALAERLERLQSRLGKLATFAFLNYTTQVDNTPAGAFYQHIREVISEVEGRLIFFELEWNDLDQQRAQQLLEDDVLDHYRHYLRSLRRYRPHLLSEAEEKILIERKVVGRSSWITLFEKVFGNLRFGEKGRTEEEVLSDLYNANREVRQKAAAEMTEGLESQNHILTHIYNTLAAEKMISDRQRSYSSWVNSMNLDNQVEDATVDALIAAVTGRYDIVQRYYGVKKRLLGLDTLYDYDRYAPLPALPAQEFSWSECREIVLSSFAGFSPEMADIGKRFFEDGYIHAPVIQGKRGGAFAHPCIPEIHPYVMVNYTGSLRDISTVAHELGHGIHMVLAADKGYFYSDTPLVLAETASVFAELVVFRSQLQLLEDENARKAFTCQKLESIFATVFRQTSMNRFEEAMHQGRRQQGELGSDALSEYWLASQRKMFGDSVTLTDDYGLWWSYIPHFLATPGYVYSYAFGELLVLALYRLYQEEGDAFIDKYFSLLAAGGSDTPYALLTPLGIDLNDENFWNQGLELIDSMLREVED